MTKTECYSTPCPHLRRDAIDNPILLAALDITSAFIATAHRLSDPTDDAPDPSLFDHYALSATIRSDAPFDSYHNMTCDIALDDELHSIAISIFYNPDFDNHISYIMLCSDTNIDIIHNSNNPNFDPYRDLR